MSMEGEHDEVVDEEAAWQTVEALDDPDPTAGEREACIAPPGNLCTDTGCWDADRCVVTPAEPDPTAGERAVVSHCEEPDHPVYALPAEPDAGDVEALAATLFEIEHGWPLADQYEFSPDRAKYAARARLVLTSPVLDAVRRKAAADALTEAADDYERMHQQPGSATGADWLRRRAARIAKETR